MKSKKRKMTEADHDKVFNEALDSALKAKAKELKTHLSIRLDSDLYMELHRRADLGEGGGKYQTLMNEMLREALFGKSAVDEIERAKKIVLNAMDKLARPKKRAG